MILQKKMAARLLAAVAKIAGPKIIEGLTLPYWLLYAIRLTGISCKEEIFRTRKVHISLLAVPSETAF